MEAEPGEVPGQLWSARRDGTSCMPEAPITWKSAPWEMRSIASEFYWLTTTQKLQCCGALGKPARTPGTRFPTRRARSVY